jgi:hypothetical protein
MILEGSLVGFWCCRRGRSVVVEEVEVLLFQMQLVEVYMPFLFINHYSYGYEE